jgi:hypothetical protein
MGKRISSKYLKMKKNGVMSRNIMKGGKPANGLSSVWRKAAKMKANQQLAKWRNVGIYVSAKISLNISESGESI